jgi:hypothetical protein
MDYAAVGRATYQPYLWTPMPLYALISPTDNPALEKAVEDKFKDKFFKVAPGQFVVWPDSATTQEVAAQLGIPGNSAGLGIVLVLAVSNYTGWHNRDLWEWLAAQSKRPPTPPP